MLQIFTLKGWRPNMRKCRLPLSAFTGHYVRPYLQNRAFLYNEIHRHDQHKIGRLEV